MCLWFKTRTSQKLRISTYVLKNFGQIEGLCLFSVQKYFPSIGRCGICSLIWIISTFLNASFRIFCPAATCRTTFWKTSFGILPSIIAMNTFSTFSIIPSTKIWISLACLNFHITFVTIRFPISATNWAVRPITTFSITVWAELIFRLNF